MSLSSRDVLTLGCLPAGHDCLPAALWFIRRLAAMPKKPLLYSILVPSGFSPFSRLSAQAILHVYLLSESTISAMVVAAYLVFACFFLNLSSPSAVDGQHAQSVPTDKSGIKERQLSAASRDIDVAKRSSSIVLDENVSMHYMDGLHRPYTMCTSNPG